MNNFRFQVVCGLDKFKAVKGNIDMLHGSKIKINEIYKGFYAISPGTGEGSLWCDEITWAWHTWDLPEQIRMTGTQGQVMQ